MSTSMEIPTRALPDVSTLSTVETADFARHESTIERGLKNFIEVGNALWDIIDRRLYRQTHATFKDYVEQRWNMSVRRAYQLAECTATLKALPPSVQNFAQTESHVAELARIPPDHRVEVLKRVEAKARSTKRKATAKDIREAADTEDPATAPTVERFECDQCSARFESDDDAVSLYECAECCTMFTQETSANGSGHSCPDCNKFGAKVSDHGCPECDEGELEEIGADAAPPGEDATDPAVIQRSKSLHGRNDRRVTKQWWYQRASAKDRGEFLEQWIFRSNRPVVVPSKEEFRKAIDRWMDDAVKEGGK